MTKSLINDKRHSKPCVCIRQTECQSFTEYLMLHLRSMTIIWLWKNLFFFYLETVVPHSKHTAIRRPLQPCQILSLALKMLQTKWQNGIPFVNASQAKFLAKKSNILIFPGYLTLSLIKNMPPKVPPPHKKYWFSLKYNHPRFSFWE